MTRSEVVKEIEEKNKVYSIELLGSKKDKADGFYIIMNTQQTMSDDKDIFHFITKETLKLLDRAEITYFIKDK